MKDKVLIITGSSGIAAETIKIATEQGAKVFYISKTEASCAALLESLQSAGQTADYVVGDLTDPLIVNHFVKQCLKKYGRIDGLFNVAGISGRKYGDGPAHECTDEGWNLTIDANVTTQFRMCREVLNVMLAQAPDDHGLRGTILNMSSILALSPEPKFFNTIGYSAAKGAILSMSRSMAACYASSGIRVNAIAPGLASTIMSERASSNPEILDFMKVKQPLIKTVMSAKDIAQSAMFLLSSQSKVITGETLIVDAGWSIS